jgi:folate-binding protein YgfZ
MSIEDHYRAIREGAAIGAIAARSHIALTGADRAAFLQGLLTNDVQGLAPGAGCYAAWLSREGRMLTDMHVLASAGMILLDVPTAELQATLERLDQFIFSEDVQVAALADSLRAIWVHGPRAAMTIEMAIPGAEGLAGWGDYRHEPIGSQGIVAARIDQLLVPGYCLFVEPGAETRVIAALEGAGAVVAGDDALEAARIEAGYPVFGIDMTGDTIPLEAGIEDRAISFTKGCYVGQEIIIRVLHRGGGRVARKLVGLRLEGAATRGAKVFSGEREVGAITSAAVAPTRGPIALGYLHRDFVAAGTAVAVETAAGRTPATVTERPTTSNAAGT